MAPGQLKFKMHFNYPVAGYAIGRFRLSVTADDRSGFADGEDSDGDVEANWIVLTDPSVSLPSGMTSLVLDDDDSILIGGTVSNGIYEINYTTSVSQITGIRLEVIEDDSLPHKGPGLYNSNGNFVLSEFTLEAAPM
ncbi:MAG: hypothetical protein GY749_14205 [Desulfobacteraceae bacterium]|nr:hypothetical protein [Desulfobacteraceae bacterium]